MPTDLPPDYKPRPTPIPEPGSTAPGAVPDPNTPPAGDDVQNPGLRPQPDLGTGPLLPGEDDGDVVDPGPGGFGTPAPAGVPGGGLPSA